MPQPLPLPLPETLSAISVVQMLAAATDRRAMAGLLSQVFISGHRAFFDGVRLAYDKLAIFGVTQVAEIAADDLTPDDPGRFGFADFVLLTDRLRRGMTSGAARAAIDAAASVCHGPSWNGFYRRILLKESCIGCDMVSVNRVLARLGKKLPEAKQWLIPVFGCQMAQDATAVGPTGPKLLDAKLAGLRTLAVLDTGFGTVTLFDRHGQPIEGFADVRGGLRQVLTLLPGAVVLDGVLRSPQGVAHLRSLLKHPERDASMVRLALFDMLPLSDFRLGFCPQPQWQRHRSLALLATTGLLRRAGDTAYVITKQEVDLDDPAGATAFAAFCRDSAAARLDGVMLKDPEAPYRFKRSAAWLTQTCQSTDVA